MLCNYVQLTLDILLFAVSYGNHGCKGGNMYNAYQYIVANDGVTTASSYPFISKVIKLLTIGATLIFKRIFKKGHLGYIDSEAFGGSFSIAQRHS